MLTICIRRGVLVVLVEQRDGRPMLEWVGRCVAPGGSVRERQRALAGTHRRDRPFLNFNLACFLFREQESAPPYTCQRET